MPPFRPPTSSLGFRAAMRPRWKLKRPPVRSAASYGRTGAAANSKTRVMSNRIVYFENSHTEPRSYPGGNTPDEHRELPASGFRHDRMANQYRKTEIKRETCIDGVLSEPSAEKAA